MIIKIEIAGNEKQIELCEAETFQDAMEEMNNYIAENKYLKDYMWFAFYTSDDYVDKVNVDFGSETTSFWIYDIPDTFRTDLRRYSEEYEELRNGGFYK